MEKTDKQKMEQMRTQVLVQINALQEKATEFYDSFLNSIATPLFINTEQINKIYDLNIPISADGDTLGKIIKGYNTQIAGSIDEMKLTKDEINSFFDAAKAKATIAMDADEFIIVQLAIKLLPAYVLAVQTSNASKNFIFETIGLLKKSGQL